MWPQTFKVVTTFYCCVSLFFEADLAQCPTGQFGPNCINECLCNQNLCSETGECQPDVSCKPGFFGYLCQYSNKTSDWEKCFRTHTLKALRQCRPWEGTGLCPGVDLGFKAKTSHPTLFDQSDTTCLPMNNTITLVELEKYYSIAFLRFISKTPAVIDLIIIEFTSTISCNQYRVFIRYPSEWDIFCKVDKAVNKITIWWLAAAKICSIYISGARKVMSVNYQVPYVTVSYRTASTSRTNSTADSKPSGFPGTKTISPREVEIKTLVTSSLLPPGSSSGTKKTPRLEERTGGQILGVTEENSTFGNTTRNNSMEISSMKNVAKRDLFSMCKLLSNDKNEKLSVTLNVEHIMYRLLVTVLSLDNGTHSILFQFNDASSYQQYNQTVALNLTQFQSHIIDIALVGLWAKTILISEVGHPVSSFMSVCNLNIYGDCREGSYGLQCDKRCDSACFYDSCDISNGYCILCSEEQAECDNPSPDLSFTCGKHKYGPLCNKPCKSCFGGACDRRTGACIKDCGPPEVCFMRVDQCPLFKYGENCSQMCSFCRMGLCNRTTGVCLKGCSQNRFGDFCNYTCSDHCANRKCDGYTWECSDGCVGLFTGPLCDQVCSNNCAGEGKCDQHNRTCVAGCLEGYDDSRCEIPRKPLIVYAILIVGMLLTVVILIVCVDNDEITDQESFVSGTGEATSLLEAPDDKFREETETAAMTQAEDVITVASDENLRHNIGDANISPLIPERTCVPSSSIDPDHLPNDASSSGMMGTRIEELMARNYDLSNSGIESEV